MSSFLSSAAFIARRDFAHLMKQRETLLWVFVMPILFFYFIGTVTGGATGPSEDRPDPLALLAPPGSGFLVDELVSHLEEQDFEVRRVQTAEELEGYGRRLRIPSPPAPHDGFTDAVLAGEPMELQWGRSGDGPATQFDQVRIARAVYGLLADLVVVTGAAGGDAGSEASGSRESTGGPAETSPAPPANPTLESPGVPRKPTAQDFRRLAEMPRSLTLAVEPAGERLEAPQGYEQTIPGITVMFAMLVMLSSGSVLLVIERQQGLLRRLASTPLSRGTVVAGKLGARMGLGTIQVGFGMLAGTVLFSMSWGESLWMVIVVLTAWALFCASLALVLGNLARTEGQVIGLGITSTMVLAALGGCWWPIEVTPEWMQTLALTLPTGWTMDAMHRLISFGYGPDSVIPHLVALLGGSAALGWLGARTFRYQ